MSQIETTNVHSLSDFRREQQTLRAAGLAPDQFTRAFRNHAAGVAVITADAGDGPVGLTATSVFSVSAEPPMLVFSVSDRSSSAPTIRQASHVVVHLLGADQLSLARLCATSGVDRFADTSIWDRLETGEPYFTSVQARIRGRVVDTLEAGSSTLVVVHALDAAFSESESAAPPLVYHNRNWHQLGQPSQIEG
jgi:flavin reductase (DIM6/NTAB) family NADH-FMN oxidoreductase RutF